jgi:hypothetical protein
MTTIFDYTTRETLINRISKLSLESVPRWGKMNVYQMVKHNIIWNDWVLGNHNPKYSQTFMGWLFGKRVLRSMMRDERPIAKNIPTSNPFKVAEVTGNLDEEVFTLIKLIAQYQHFNNPRFKHDFFGKMTKEEIGVLVYKHTDHHLRQFGV